MADPSSSSIELTPAQNAQYDMITRRLQEVLGGDAIKTILKEDKTVKAYWGAAYRILCSINKDCRFSEGRCSSKSSASRTEYYKHILLAVFNSLGIPTSKLIFVQGSSYQLTKEYNMDNYRLCAIVTEHDAKKAGAEVVKQVESPLLSGLLYPGLQALDEQYLDVDFQFGGIDQRKIFTFAELYLPRLGYRKRSHLMNTMVPGLMGGKMSSSDPNSKIDFLDSPEAVKRKVKASFCEPGNVEDNGLLSFAEAVLFPISQLKIDQAKGIAGEGGNEVSSADPNPFTSKNAPEGTLFTVTTKFDGDLHFKTFEELKQGFKEEKVHPGDLKPTMTNAINRLLDPIRKAFEENEDFQKVEKLAYPDPNAKQLSKKKKEKVYHPPPPGKGKNAKPLDGAAPADSSVLAPADSQIPNSGVLP
ncbi:hypothetical protein D9757_003761 [Collybiopsis confluens]|uniref:tyrosine--tRNA ligase n=1 Tax=Collybiopsis confluens TaxID=2823264 RepID=A0A8H5HVK9_9AGAR|nr:hypothetical protein D9757_003761 [Collybiopsis confluens]